MHMKTQDEKNEVKNANSTWRSKRRRTDEEVAGECEKWSRERAMEGQNKFDPPTP